MRKTMTGILPNAQVKTVFTLRKLQYAGQKDTFSQFSLFCQRSKYYKIVRSSVFLEKREDNWT